MIINKDGTITYEITTPDCDDEIALEREFGYYREDVEEQVKKLAEYGRMVILVIDKDGNYTQLK